MTHFVNIFGVMVIDFFADLYLENTCFAGDSLKSSNRNGSPKETRLLLVVFCVADRTELAAIVAMAVCNGASANMQKAPTAATVRAFAYY